MLSSDNSRKRVETKSVDSTIGYCCIMKYKGSWPVLMVRIPISKKREERLELYYKKRGRFI